MTSAVLALGHDVAVEGRATYRLQPATAPGSATHRVQLFSISDVDDEVRDLLRSAYEQNG